MEFYPQRNQISSFLQEEASVADLELRGRLDLGRCRQKSILYPENNIIFRQHHRVKITNEKKGLFPDK